MANSVSVLYYPFASTTSHAELRAGDKTFYIGVCTDGTPTLDNYTSRLERAKQGGSPFIEFNVRATPDQAAQIHEAIHQKPASGETTCMKSAADILKDKANVVIPTPAAYLPFSAALWMGGKYLYGKLPFAKPEITQITFVGKLPKSKAILKGLARASIESAAVPLTIAKSILQQPLKASISLRQMIAESFSPSINISEMLL